MSSDGKSANLVLDIVVITAAIAIIKFFIPSIPWWIIIIPTAIFFLTLFVMFIAIFVYMRGFADYERRTHPGRGRRDCR